MASLPPGSAPLAYAAEGTPDPYAGFETRIVPENITLLPKTAHQVTGGNAWNERSITVKKGENISTILQGARRHARRDRGDRRGTRTARPRQRAEGRPEAAHPGGDGPSPRRVCSRSASIVMGDSSIEAVVALSDKGKYVSVDVASMNTLVSETRGRGG